MKPALIGSAVGISILVVSVLTAHYVQSDTPPPPQAIKPLIAGDYLVAAPGRIEPASGEMRIGAAVTAVLKEVTVKAGDHVTRNEVVARLQSDDIAAAVVKAQADLRLAEAQLQRLIDGPLPAERAEALAAVAETTAAQKYAAAELARQQKLGNLKIASQSAVEKAELAYAQAFEKQNAAQDRYAVINDPTRADDVAVAQARVDAAQAAANDAQARLDETVIRSPVDGVVLRTYLHPGELVSVFFDRPIMTIGDISHLYVRAEVAAADIAKVKVGLSAYVTADAYGDKRFYGRVERVAEEFGKTTVLTDDPRQKTDTKVLDVLIALDEPNPLRPGFEVNAFITREEPAKTAETTE